MIAQFLREFNDDKLNENCLNICGASMIPVFIFNPSNLISSNTWTMLKSHNGSVVVALDCSEVESKTEFFSEIFEGIIRESSADKLMIPSDFSEFFAALKPNVKDIVVIFNNSSQINLTHLDDFVRLWERKKMKSSPRLRFIFDDSVCFLGMESRLRDHFRVKDVQVPRVNEVFDYLVIELINNQLPFLLHPELMKRFVDLTYSGTISLTSILNQLKFLLISHFSKRKSGSQQDTFGGLKDIFKFITELSINLRQIRPSTPVLSPSKDFYSVILWGNLVDSQAYFEIINELKSMGPNDFVSLFKNICNSTEKSDKLAGFVDSMIAGLKEKISTSTSAQIKDFQLDLVTTLSDFLRSIKIIIPDDYVINDPKGNVRKAFEADPLAALQVALKYPSVYLNCKNGCCCSSAVSNDVPLCSSNLNSRLAPLFHNKSTMLDICLLYRLSLEFPSKSINLMSWYKSFSSIVTTSKRQTADKSQIT